MKTYSTARIGEVVHIVKRSKGEFATRCGKSLSFWDLLLMLQPPERITCLECRWRARV